MSTAEWRTDETRGNGPRVRFGVWNSAIGILISTCLLYGLLLNPYWVRHGDSEVMIGIARSLTRGQGFQFNGQPIGVVPPGWPAVLAAAMKLSTSLLFLKMLSAASLVGFLLLSYDVLLHVTRRREALGCVLITALLQPVFVLATLFFSDPLFCLLATAWLCVALRVGTTDRFWPMLGALLLLGVATIVVRWAGAAWFLLVAAAIFHGEEIRWRWSRRWLAAVLTGAVTLAAFFAVRRIMYVDPRTIDSRYSVFLIGTYNLFNVQNLSLQLQQFGLWLSALFWAPSAWVRSIRVPAEIFGCLLFAIILIGSVRAARRRNWLFLGATLYTGFLAADWPNPMPRYLIPAAPLLAAAAWEGLGFCRRYYVPAVLAISIVITNGVIYCNDLIAMRSAHFYAHFQAGGNQSLIDAASRLHALDNGRPIVVSGKYVNFGRPLSSDGFRRAFYFLIDRPVMNDNAIWGEPTPELIAALRKRKAGWYLYRPATQVFLHTDYSDVPADTDWRLFRIDGDVAKRIKLTPTRNWPKHVPQW